MFDRNFDLKFLKCRNKKIFLIGINKVGKGSNNKKFLLFGNIFFRKFFCLKFLSRFFPKLKSLKKNVFFPNFTNWGVWKWSNFYKFTVQFSFKNFICSEFLTNFYVKYSEFGKMLKKKQNWINMKNFQKLTNVYFFIKFLPKNFVKYMFEISIHNFSLKIQQIGAFEN